MTDFSTVTNEDIPLADDDDSVPINGTPRPAQPLPREEPPEDPEEKARLISQVLELQNTLDGECFALVLVFEYRIGERCSAFLISRLSSRSESI
ncbi:unnamed protein product [Haemonchus placei]|uniref:Uncharacterized protein n=1 Tax=Haemonchus placei TaxID=6290 RepID=A0A0N4WDQ2_HAEPC|nr:unnamed protein product [Haemonchus placei]